MKKNQSILLKSFVFLLFFAGINSLNANIKIIYINGAIQDRGNEHKLSNKIYEQLQINYGKNIVSNPMKANNPELTNSLSIDDIAKINSQQNLKTRPRGDTIAENFIPKEHQWNFLFSDIIRIISEENSFYLIIFGNAQNILRKTIEEFQNQNYLNNLQDYFKKFIVIQPPKIEEFDSFEEKDLEEAIDKLNHLDDDKEELFSKSPSSPIIKVSDETENFIKLKSEKPINIDEIKSAISKWQIAKLKLSKKYNEFIVKKIITKISNSID